MRLAKSVYSRESLEEAAAALGRRARVYVTAAGKSWSVAVRPAARTNDFLDEALAHVLRERLLELTRPLAAAAASSALDRGLTPQPADPLEELEPQVKADRQAEAAALLEEAKRL